MVAHPVVGTVISPLQHPAGGVQPILLPGKHFLQEDYPEEIAEAEFDALLNSAELRIVRTCKLHAPYVLIEAARADVRAV